MVSHAWKIRCQTATGRTARPSVSLFTDPEEHGELTEALYKIKPEKFTQETYLPVYFFCINNYTNPEAARIARSHCTDITRDVDRINFKLTKILRAEVGSWKSLDQAFDNFIHVDEDFLYQFEKDMAEVDKVLTEIVRLLQYDPEAAWRKYEDLRSALLADLAELREAFKNMRKAENHIRRLLT